MPARLFSCLPLGTTLILEGPAVAQSPDPAPPFLMRSPAISPDGGTIAFVYRGRICTVDSAGAEALAPTDPQFRATKPVWAPNGSAVALSAAVSNAGEVCIAPRDGGEIRRLACNERADVPLAFTPNGRDILFASTGISPMETNFLHAFTFSPLRAVLSVPAAGGRERRVLANPPPQAAVSPDGDLIARVFERSPDVTLRKRQISDGATDIRIPDRRTGEHRQLTTQRGREVSPAFSPDGRYIDTTSGFESGHSEVQVIEVASGESHDNSLDGFADRVPQFSSDGTMVFYWLSDRFSMRQRDHQTAANDVVGVFLPREAAADHAAGRRTGRCASRASRR